MPKLLRKTQSPPTPPSFVVRGGAVTMVTTSPPRLQVTVVRKWRKPPINAKKPPKPKNQGRRTMKTPTFLKTLMTRDKRFALNSLKPAITSPSNQTQGLALMAPLNNNHRRPGIVLPTPRTFCAVVSSWMNET